MQKGHRQDHLSKLVIGNQIKRGFKNSARFKRVILINDAGLGVILIKDDEVGV